MGPLISAGQRETVGSFVPDGAPVAIQGSVPDGPGLLVPADRAVPGRPGRPRRARGDLRAGRRRRPVPHRGRGDRAGQRHDLRALRLDLDARRRARRCGSRAPSRPACCRSTPTPRCASRRRSAASSSRATAASSGRTRSTPTPSSRPSTTRREADGRAWTGRSASSRARRAASAPRPCGASRRRARRSSASTCATTRRASTSRSPATSPTRTRCAGMFAAVRARVRHDRRAVQQRRHLAARGRLGARDGDRRLGPRAGRQRQVGLLLLQARHPAPARDRRRLGDQHRVVRGGDGRGHVADRLHGLQGRGAVALARARAWSSRAAACA